MLVTLKRLCCSSLFGSTCTLRCWKSCVKPNWVLNGALKSWMRSALLMFQNVHLTFYYQDLNRDKFMKRNWKSMAQKHKFGSTTYNILSNKVFTMMLKWFTQWLYSKQLTKNCFLIKFDFCFNGHSRYFFHCQKPNKTINECSGSCQKIIKECSLGKQLFWIEISST